MGGRDDDTGHWTLTPLTVIIGWESPFEKVSW
jgi:hypothetical protein